MAGSEWGKINRGQPFHVLTVDIDRALAHLRMNDYEQMLVQYVREHSWGVVTRRKRRGEPWPDPKPCAVNTSELARAWGVPRQRLSGAKVSLLSRRILCQSDDGYTISKDVDSWAGLSPASIAYAKSSVGCIEEPDACAERNSVHPEDENRTLLRSVHAEKPNAFAFGGERENVQGVNAKTFRGERNSVQGVNGKTFGSERENVQGVVPPPGTPHRGTHASEEKSKYRDRQSDGTSGHSTDVATAPEIFSEPSDPELEQAHRNLRRVIEAARIAAGPRGEQWAGMYAHEYPDIERLIWAIGEASRFLKAGGQIRSFGGWVRAKYEATHEAAAPAVVKSSPRDEFVPVTPEERERLRKMREFNLARNEAKRSGQANGKATAV